MEKIAVGVDIENIRKFQDLEQNKDRKFLKKIFTDFEIDYCFQKINPPDTSTSRILFGFATHLSILVGVWHSGGNFAKNSLRSSN